MTAWKPHVYRTGGESQQFDAVPTDLDAHRKQIEPWLSAVFQSEHLSLLVGSGLSAAVSAIAKTKGVGMGLASFDTTLNDLIKRKAEEAAKLCARGKPNLEDQVRVGLALLAGLELLDDSRAKELRNAIENILLSLLDGVLGLERGLNEKLEALKDEGLEAQRLLASFLLSFASRTASRERLHVFTTNYDRIVEWGSDALGLRMIDRFVGTLAPVFRSSRMDVDYHYNPPGIRGEPRFLEGVIRFSKLHGSVDWQLSGTAIVRADVPFGAKQDHPAVPQDPVKSLLIYPNPAKDIETIAYPYAELFRDFSAATCRPNSVLVTYGYGFGDDHINRIIQDCLTIPSTHLVIISFDDASGRIPAFCERIGRDAQISLLIGSHFGDLITLVEHYLPKPAIDLITQRKSELLRRRLVHTIGHDSSGGTA
jgi:SIR2-like protein